MERFYLCLTKILCKWFCLSKMFLFIEHMQMVSLYLCSSHSTHTYKSYTPHTTQIVNIWKFKSVRCHRRIQYNVLKNEQFQNHDDDNRSHSLSLSCTTSRALQIKHSNINQCHVLCLFHSFFIGKKPKWILMVCQKSPNSMGWNWAFTCDFYVTLDRCNRCKLIHHNKRHTKHLFGHTTDKRHESEVAFCDFISISNYF